MKMLLIAAVTTITIAAPLGFAYAQAPENSPSTAMDKGGGSHTGNNLKATHADPQTAGSGGTTHGTTTSGGGSGMSGTGTTRGGMGAGGGAQ